MRKYNESSNEKVINLNLMSCCSHPICLQYLSRASRNSQESASWIVKTKDNQKKTFIFIRFRKYLLSH